MSKTLAGMQPEQRPKALSLPKLFAVIAVSLAACGRGPAPAVDPGTGSPTGSTAPTTPAAAAAPKTPDPSPTQAATPATLDPLGAAVYGDSQAAVAGQVLGTTIHTADAEELRYYVLEALTGRYAREFGIEVTAEEQATYLSHMQAVMRDDPNFKDLPDIDEQSDEDRAARAEIAGAFIRQWKINRALHQQYGGRIVYQQGGAEPLDAYRRFLEEAQARGDFKILATNLEDGFWRYYRDESIHDFYKPGSVEALNAFAAPPWEGK